MYDQRRIGTESPDTTRFSDGFLTLEVQRYVMPCSWGLPQEVVLQTNIYFVPQGFLQKIVDPRLNSIGLMQLTLWPDKPKMQYYFLFGNSIRLAGHSGSVHRSGFHTIHLPAEIMKNLNPCLAERPVDMAKLLGILTGGANPILGQPELPPQRLLATGSQ